MDALTLWISWVWKKGAVRHKAATTSRVLDSISGVSAFAFNAVERFNRQTIMFSNFDLILDRLDSGERYFAETQGKYVDPSSMDSAQKEQLAADEAPVPNRTVERWPCA